MPTMGAAGYGDVVMMRAGFGSGRSPGSRESRQPQRPRRLHAISYAIGRG